MKRLHPLCNAAATGIAVLVLASPVASFAGAMAQGHHCDQRHQVSAEQRGQWAKKHLEHEAAMLEIKASQQAAWDAYSAAKLEMMTAFGDGRPMLPDADAAAAMRQRAEQATAMAQRLSKLADATASLQSVLDEGQRKVLDRIVRMHDQCLDGHHHDGGAGSEHRHHGSGMSPKAAKPAPAAATAVKPKN
jgi:cell fate (sporulation/competence/biofilm development) regulator YlbF (YheA/YmcA/DUF963 family)